MSALLETSGWLPSLADGAGQRPESGSLSVEPLGALDPDRVYGLLAALPDAAQGWVCLASEIWLRDGGVWTAVSGDAGSPPRFDGSLLLSAELAISAFESLHLRRLG